MSRTLIAICLSVGLAVVCAAQGRPIRVPSAPSLSPDGGLVAFAWERDVWIAPSGGGVARRLTLHPADDFTPFFSPDGGSVAFVSTRTGGPQIFVVPVGGGAPRQITRVSLARSLHGYVDAEHLLVSRRSDAHFHSSESSRLYTVSLEDGGADLLLDAGAFEPALRRDGKALLFTRGRASWSRKGYRGSQAAQMWHADLAVAPPVLRRLDADLEAFQNVSWKGPMWAADGTSFFYVSDPDGTFDIWSYDLASGASTRVTNLAAADNTDDGVASPAISADGGTIVFRRRFDLHRLDVATGVISAIPLVTSGDEVAAFDERVTDDRAIAAAFTDDGKQIAIVSGNDVWVMDRVLREPVRVTDTAHREGALTFSNDGGHLFFTSDDGDEVDIWKVTCDHEKGWWWQSEVFAMERVTEDAAVESRLSASPTGDHIAYVKGTDLFVMDSDGTDHRRIVESWSPPSFDWSPDGKWLAYTTQDDDYNSDVFIVPIDGTRAPFNVSRHPDRDWDPTWSRDGKRLAFVGRRDGEEADIYWINLARSAEEETDRDRKLKEAVEAMEKGAKKKKAAAKADGDKSGEETAAGSAGADKLESTKSEPKKKKDDVVVVIDFDGLLDRVHRIRIPDSTESGLLWSPDGKKLAFSATVDGKRAFYTVEFPDVGRPVKLADSALSSARWLKESKEIVGLSGRNGSPAAMSASGKTESFPFEVRFERDWRLTRRLAFAQGWRAMRDRFYDENYNNRDWMAIRRKYEPVAAECLGAAEFSTVMNMMLGELNASHMGHRGGSDPLPRHDPGESWRPATHHLGLRFDRAHRGKGLRVSGVIPNGPTSRERSRVRVGEILTGVDGVAVDSPKSLEAALTLDRTRDVKLSVIGSEGETRTVTVRPVTSVAGLLYDEWVEARRAEVERLGEGRLGYLHIRGMNMTSFRQMEEDLYHAGSGKEGLIVDVRFNGGGSTTDHVLTALTQPVHAVTVSRGSGEGYPQDRKIYASWSKPVVLMCNEHSFSNAEILSHAVKQLGRGRLVGMRTAGGVISTGSVRLLDGSMVRMPMRGWYLASTGEDMELNGCLPHIALWNDPLGDDRQLAAAITALREDVEAWKARERPDPVPAAEKRRREAEGK